MVDIPFQIVLSCPATVYTKRETMDKRQQPSPERAEAL
jgi:hypothetical protein